MKRKHCHSNEIVVDAEGVTNVDHTFASFLIAFETFAKERLASRIQLVGATSDLQEAIDLLGGLS